MPEITRFSGIIIRMFLEPRTQHSQPHFHAYYQEFVGVIAIDTVELIAGELPQKQLRLVIAWAEIHQEELIKDWDLLQNGRPPFKIEPLVINMEHSIIKAKHAQAHSSSFTIDVEFDNGVKRTIHLESVLNGPFYGVLREPTLFEAAYVDKETGVVQWPNGADFDPSMLYFWEAYKDELAERALSW